MLPDGSIVNMTPTLRKAVMKSVEGMAENALRCLALAQKVCALCTPTQGRASLDEMQACQAATDMNLPLLLRRRSWVP